MNWLVSVGVIADIVGILDMICGNQITHKPTISLIHLIAMTVRFK